MKKFNLFFICFALFLFSCAKEGVEDKETKKEVDATFSLKMAKSFGEEGVVIEKVRFMLYNQGTGVFFNYTTTNETLKIDSEGKFTVSLIAGVVYEFAIIINETPELTEIANKMVNVEIYNNEPKFDLLNKGLGTHNVPLYNCGNLKPKANGIVEIEQMYNADGLNEWISQDDKTFYMPRLMSQVSLFLRKGDDITDEVIINSVKVVNTAKLTSLTDFYVAEFAAPIDLYNGAAKAITATEGEVSYNSKKYSSFSSAIIQEKSFRGPENLNGKVDQTVDKAAYLLINATYGGSTTNYKVLIGEDPLGTLGEGPKYAIQRNTHYKVYATIKSRGDASFLSVVEL